jgi:pyrroline-5-carboxylate reductase
MKESVQQKLTIIGTGNIGGAIARGLAQGSLIEVSDICCTDRSQPLLDRLQAAYPEIRVSTDNVEAVRGADIVIVAVKPWLVESVIDEIKTTLDYDRQLVVSVAAGVSFEQLNAYLVKHSGFNRNTPTIFRLIPNTAIEVLSSMTFVSACNASKEQTDRILAIFSELGHAMLVDERLMTAGTALASSGIAFALRYVRAAIEGGVELGFYPQEAQEIVLHTVKGAVDLLLANRSNPEQEIDRVTTPGGITIRGLNEMELSGFTSSVIRGLKASK